MPEKRRYPFEPKKPGKKRSLKKGVYPHRYWFIRAAEFCGSQRELARLMGVSPDRIWQYIHKSKNLHPHVAIKLDQVIKERAKELGVQVPFFKSNMRPDLFKGTQKEKAFKDIYIGAKNNYGENGEKALERKKRREAEQAGTGEEGGSESSAD